MARLRVPARGPADADLLCAVRTFHADTLKGEWFDAFNVNSKNWMQKSAGTRAWIEECNRLLGRCVQEQPREEPARLREAFEMLFGLLRRIDDGDDSLVFFADEAGSWQVGVDWQRVLPAWFRCLSMVTGPEEYARQVRQAVDEFDPTHSARHVARARRLATPDQRKALRN
ncbi:MAG: hypothetical protein AB1758_23430 [Candidatus Eremiobacterota bacterium]